MDLTTEDILNSINKPKLPMQPLGMPGPNALLGMAQNTAKAIPEYLKDIYSRMQRSVTQGPYSSPTGEYDPSIGTLPLEAMMPGYGRAVGLGSSGGRFRAALSGKKTGFFSNDVRESMSRISEKLGDVPEKLKIQAFRERFPHYDGSDSTIRKEFARTEGRGMYARPSHEIELGAFGGRRKDIAKPNLKDEEVNYAPSRHGADINKKGYSFNETHPPHPDYPNDPRRYEIVYRDDKGNVKGSLVFATDKEKNIVNKNLYGEPEDITMFVSPDYRDKGVALELLRLARQNGIKVNEKVLQGMNYTQSGADFVNGLGPLIAKKGGGGEFELGAFGGKGRLNTDSPGEAIGRLQEQLPVTKQWVEEWAKDANVPIKSITGQDTKYIKLEGQKRPGDKDVTVRIPQDEERHFGSNVRKTEIGNLFDTGLSNKKPSGGTIPYRKRNEYTQINQSAMPYAHPEALDAALKWRLSKAPHGGNWLIPEEMAPRLPQPRQQTPVNRDFMDLNQQILELLKRQ